MNESEASNRRDGQSREADEQVDANRAMREHLEDRNQHRKPELSSAKSNEPAEHGYAGSGAKRGRRTTDGVEPLARFQRSGSHKVATMAQLAILDVSHNP